jgi:hypothetical protein
MCVRMLDRIEDVIGKYLPYLVAVAAVPVVFFILDLEGVF